MDALKLIAQDSVKTEIPQFEVGDTIRSARESRFLRVL